MKKILNYSLIMFVFLFGVVSCQQDRLGELKKNTFKVSAEIADPSTKVTYGVDNYNNTITPQWTEGDKIIGFDDKGVKFEFSISAVDPTTKKATIDVGTYTPGEEATKLYAIYYPGKTTDDISSNTLTVDLSAQSGSALGNDSPVLMCATAQIDPTETKLIFENQTAIVGIKRMKIDPTTTINSVKVSGLVTSGKFKVVEGTLVLEAATTIDTVEVSDITLTSDGDGIVGTSTTPALMFATLPMDNAKINISGTTSASAEYVTLTTLKTDIAAGKYYYADKVLTTDVAAIGSTTYGCLSAAFAAAGTSTIKILKDCEADATLTVASGKTVTLDLNGKTVTISGDDKADPKVANRIEVVGGDLTITDNSSDVVASQGSIVAAEGTKGTSNVVAIGGTLTIAGGNIISNPANSDKIDAAVYGKNGATVNVTGGYIRGEGSEGALSVNSSTDDIAASKVCSLTVTGGKLEYSAGKNSTLYIYRSNATISGGHILNSYTDQSGGAAITANNQDNNTATVSVNVSGDANIESKALYGLRSRYGMPVNISGGRISGRKPLFADDGAAICTVSGGEIYNTKLGWAVLYASDGAKINVSGGKLYAYTTSVLTKIAGDGSNIAFSGSVISNKPFLNDLVASGSVVDRNVDSENPEYVFKLVEAENSITATVDGGIYHCTPAGALQYVNSSSSAVTLTVQKSFSTTEYKFNKERENPITLDLNGCTISSASTDQDNLIYSGSSLTVTDSSNPSTGRIEGGHSAVRANGGTLTIAGGTITGDGSDAAKSGVVYAESAVDALNITGGTIICNGNATQGRAVNIGCAGTMTGGKITSSGSGLRMFTKGTMFTVDGADVQVSNTETADATLLIANANTSLLIINGHFFAGNSEKAMQSDDSRVNITGGYFNREVATPDTHECVDCPDAEKKYGGKTYTHKVQAKAGLPDIAQVTIGGTTTSYKSFELALSATTNASGNATLKLLTEKSTIEWNGPLDLTNVNGKEVTFDFNGNTLSGSTSGKHFVKTEGTLTLTDTSDEPGTLICNGFRVIEPIGTATVNIKKINVTSSRKGSGYTGADSSLIVIPSGTTVNVSDNATVYRETSGFKLFYVAGTLNINACRMYVGDITSPTAKGYNLMYVISTGNVTINEGACLRAAGGSTNGLIRSSSSNAKITINGGYFYSPVIYEAGTGKPEYMKAVTMNGGYYSSDITKISAVDSYAKYGTGKSFQTQSPAASYNWSSSETLNFSYVVKTTPAN